MATHINFPFFSFRSLFRAMCFVAFGFFCGFFAKPAFSKGAISSYDAPTHINWWCIQHGHSPSGTHGAHRVHSVAHVAAPHITALHA
jgi:hypothetical protein